MDFDDVQDRLAAERPEATPLELDRAKERALAGHRRATHRSHVARSRAVTVAVVAALGVATSAVVGMAGGASGNQNGSAKSLYCPPSSPAGGIIKAPAPANCGSTTG